MKARESISINQEKKSKRRSRRRRKKKKLFTTFYSYVVFLFFVLKEEKEENSLTYKSALSIHLHREVTAYRFKIISSSSSC
jgi:hypothetical protein